MALEEDWILFLEKNPQFYQISKGDFYIQFLEKIADSAKNFSDLRSIFPIIEEDDLHIILDTLLKLKVISKVKTGSDFFFTLSADGKKLLIAYNKTKRFFNTQSRSF